MELLGGEGRDGGYYRSQNIGNSPRAERRASPTLLKQYTPYPLTPQISYYVIDKNLANYVA